MRASRWWEGVRGIEGVFIGCQPTSVDLCFLPRSIKTRLRITLTCRSERILTE